MVTIHVSFQEDTTGFVYLAHLLESKQFILDDLWTHDDDETDVQLYNYQDISEENKNE